MKGFSSCTVCGVEMPRTDCESCHGSGLVEHDVVPSRPHLEAILGRELDQLERVLGLQSERLEHMLPEHHVQISDNHRRAAGHSVKRLDDETGVPHLTLAALRLLMAVAAGRKNG